MRFTSRQPALALIAVATLTTCLASVHPSAWAQSLPPYLARQPDFNPMITSVLPGDIDIPLQKQLEGEGKFAQVQREFDLNAWQMFLALNWPVDSTGKAKGALTDDGAPRWSDWTQSYLVFRSDGKRPAACGRDRTTQPMLTLAASDISNLAVSRGLQPLGKLSRKPSATLSAANAGLPHLTLGVISSVGELNVGRLSDTKQAFSGPLIDQNGQLVFYDIVIDPNEVKYLCETSLYNINGQVAFSHAGKTVTVPAGTSGVDASGSFELKLAWKILQGKDDVSRFYKMAATVIDIDANGKPLPREVTVGLVGMHIGHKSQSSPQWIWDTFEQVDNVEVDPLAHPQVRPSFTNPGCPSCVVNQQPATTATGGLDRTPTQVWRAIPIPPEKTALNLQARAALKGLGSVWQYYQLIDAQWPTDPSAKPTPPSAGAPDAVDNKSGGKPTPVYLTNATMETYFQGGNQSTCGQVEGGCVPNQPGPTKVFGTESCMGCHSSAGIFTSYDPTSGDSKHSGQLTADFSWLPFQKACWVGGSTPPSIDNQNCTP